MKGKSAMSANGGSNLGDQEYVREEQDASPSAQKGEKYNECLEESKTDESAMSILGGAET